MLIANAILHFSQNGPDTANILQVVEYKKVKPQMEDIWKHVT